MEMIVFQIDECGNLFFYFGRSQMDLCAHLIFKLDVLLSVAFFFTELIKKVSNNTFLKVFLMWLKNIYGKKSHDLWRSKRRRKSFKSIDTRTWIFDDSPHETIACHFSWWINHNSPPLISQKLILISQSYFSTFVFCLVLGVAGKMNHLIIHFTVHNERQVAPVLKTKIFLIWVFWTFFCIFSILPTSRVFFRLEFGG